MSLRPLAHFSDLPGPGEVGPALWVTQLSPSVTFSAPPPLNERGEKLCSWEKAYSTQGFAFWCTPWRLELSESGATLRPWSRQGDVLTLTFAREAFGSIKSDSRLIELFERSECSLETASRAGMRWVPCRTGAASLSGYHWLADAGKVPLNGRNRPVGTHVDPFRTKARIFPREECGSFCCSTTHAFVLLERKLHVTEFFHMRGFPLSSCPRPRPRVHVQMLICNRWIAWDFRVKRAAAR